MGGDATTILVRERTFKEKEGEKGREMYLLHGALALASRIDLLYGNLSSTTRVRQRSNRDANLH